MSRRMEDLDKEFRIVAESILKDCKGQGVIMKPFFTIRDPWEQAKLWRQSRTTQQIRSKANSLRGGGAPFLASVLENVGPQSGKWVTNAIPGNSWHQWGLALDCFVEENGKAVWRGKHHGYALYARVAEAHGCVAGHNWHKRDSVHIQMPAVTSPRKIHTWKEIGAYNLERYAEDHYNSRGI